MPYWSSSRVGPVSSSSKGKGNGRSKQPRKGITMEDLKKQTALRLAQEQGRGDASQSGESPAANRRYKSNANYVPSTPDRSLSNSLALPHDAPAIRMDERIHSTPTRGADANHPQSSKNHPRRVPVAPTFSANQSVDSVEMGTNAKLPHGLTVQELKEMTKARLQSEVPPVVTTEQQQQPEAWETASVSTAASDYPNSVNGSYDEAIPFSRSASYPNHGVPQSGTNISAGSNDWQENGYYEYNRRRAATLSPRPGLSYLHEDRPVMGHMPTLPSDFMQSGNISSGIHQSGLQKPPPPTQTLPMLRQRQIPSRSRSAFDMNNNRSRTSSATSLPAMGFDDHSVVGLSDVFRGSQDSQFMGFLGSNSSFADPVNQSFDNRYDTDVRGRAQTDTDIFCGELSDDLALLLKLSGAKDDLDR